MTLIFKTFSLFVLSIFFSCAKNNSEEKPVLRDLIGVWKVVYARDKVGGFEMSNDTLGVVIELFGVYLDKFEIKNNNTFSVVQNDSTHEHYYTLENEGNKVIFVSSNPLWNGTIYKDTLELTRNVDSLWLEDRLHIYKGVKSTW